MIKKIKTKKNQINKLFIFIVYKLSGNPSQLFIYI